MDFLASLNLLDLPEQQTRTSQLTESQPEFQLELGFNACCTCGKAAPKWECQNCHRVKYCSKICQEKDSSLPTDEDEEAVGHSGLVCAVLRLCNDDEAVEKGGGKSLNEKKRHAAVDRLVSEFESYPATLANVLMEGPCYQDVLHKASGGTLTIHVVGASVDSELWEGHPESSQERNVFKCYAEALAEVAESHNLDGIQLQFIGPDCPIKDITESVLLPVVQRKKSSSQLKVKTLKGEYNKRVLQSGKVASPDVVVFFNPGFTCPDYSWEKALVGIEKDVPFLVTSNTELEGIADIQYLLQKSLIQEIPVGLAEILKEDFLDDTGEYDTDSFFSVNPFCGNRVRQSGTMANDLYVKNRWMFGGIFGSRPKTQVETKPTKKIKIEGSGNSKKVNPALV